MGAEEKDPPWVEKKALGEAEIVSTLVPARRTALAAMGAILASGNAGCGSTPSRGDDKDPTDARGQGRYTDRDSGDPRRGTRKPGLYNVPHFNLPIQARVGLPVEVDSIATCEGSGWNANRLEIVTGALPPGLSLFQPKLGIRGVPTRAGTWYLRVRWSGISCSGISYDDVTQDLTIVTEGSSAPGSVR